MNEREYILNQAISECSELIHAITKALQFGMDCTYPDTHTEQN